MDLKLTEKTKTTMEIEFPQADESLLNPLKQRLLAEGDVASATVLKPHPLLANPRLFVEVTKGKPETFVKNAAKALRQELDELETLLLNETQE